MEMIAVLMISYIKTLIIVQSYYIYNIINSKMLERLWRSKTVRKNNQQVQNQQKTDQNICQYYQQKHLPNDIYCKIIQCQMQIEDGNLNKDLLIQLLQLYTAAVQFYEEVGDLRYKLFQKKIHNFLHKNSIEAVLKGSQIQGIKIVKKQKAQQQIRKAVLNNKAEAIKLIQDSEYGAQKQKQNIKKQVNRQMQILEKRIQNKRCNSLSSKNKLFTNNLSKKLQNQRLSLVPKKSNNQQDIAQINTKRQ